MPRRSLATLALGSFGAAAGAASWSLTEYSTHRWVLHGPFKSRLHRAHHRDPMQTCLPARAGGHLAVAGATAATVLGLGALLPAAATVLNSAGAAFALGYSTYEISHWNMHHRAARTRWGQRMRERHDRHHFGAPARNHGVTSPFWDRVFDTEAASSRDIDTRVGAA